MQLSVLFPANTAEAALQRGLEELVWANDGIDVYIRETLEIVKELDGVLTTIKDNVANTLDLLRTFERNLMLDRKVCLAWSVCTLLCLHGHLLEAVLGTTMCWTFKT